MAYLSLTVFSGDISEDNFNEIYPRYVFTKYVAEHWLDHAFIVENDGKFLKIVLEFLQTPSRLAWAHFFRSQTWIEACPNQKLLIGPHKWVYGGIPSLRLAAFLGRQ
jgi:hypothetical protein